MALTSKQYLQKNGMICPSCLSSKIVSEDVKINGGFGWTNTKCKNCNTIWKDTYRLTGYKDCFLSNLKTTNS